MIIVFNYSSFLGISIVSELFMSSIEKITAKTKRIHLAGGGEEEGPDVIEVPVWNGTVANLTLMALGTDCLNPQYRSLTLTQILVPWIRTKYLK